MIEDNISNINQNKINISGDKEDFKTTKIFYLLDKLELTRNYKNLLEINLSFIKPSSEEITNTFVNNFILGCENNFENVESSINKQQNLGLRVI